MNVYEKLRGKIPYIYNVNDSLIAIYRNKYSVINIASDYDRISKLKKIKKNDREEIKKAVNKLSLIAECNTKNSNAKLSEFIEKLNEAGKKELETQIKELEKLYIKYELAQ